MRRRARIGPDPPAVRCAERQDPAICGVLFFLDLDSAPPLDRTARRWLKLPNDNCAEVKNSGAASPHQRTQT